MGYWAHSWQLSEMLVGDNDHPAQTMEYWQTVEQTTAYANVNPTVTVNCVYDNYSLTPILQYPQWHRFSDVAVDPTHDCQWEGYLTEEDPNRFWVDDEGNWLTPDQAPVSAK